MVDKSENIKRNDQIKLLEIVANFTETGDFKGTFTYPNCGYDLVLQGLATEDRKITNAGKVALWLLGKGPDPTVSKACETFKFSLKRDGE